MGSVRHFARSHVRTRFLICSVGLVLSAVLTTLPAHAAFTQATCPWLYPGGPDVPVDIGSTDYNYDVNNASNYALREKYAWYVMVNSNVDHLTMHYTNFDTEPCCDHLEIDGASGATTLAGNLGTGSVYLAPMLSGGGPPPVYRATWFSDFSINRAGLPKLDKVNAICNVNAQPTNIHGYVAANRRYDGILIATGDVIYVYAHQDAGIDLKISATVLAASPSNADFDLYASSTTALPDDSDFEWRDYTGNSRGDETGAGGALYIPGVAWQRNIYIGVHSYQGAGHFMLRADSTIAEGTLSQPLTVCTPGVDLATSPDKGNVVETVDKAVLRMQGITHGHFQPAWIDFKQITDTCDAWCSNDSSCQVCMDTPCATNDYCTVGQSLGGVTRIGYHTCGIYDPPNDGESLVLAHELGHSRFQLPDEYNPWGVAQSWFCGHSTMNGPNPNSDKWCVDMNHCQESGSGTAGPPAGFDCTQSGSMWERAVSLYPGAWPGLLTQDYQGSISSQPVRLFYKGYQNRSLYQVNFE